MIHILGLAEDPLSVLLQDARLVLQASRVPRNLDHTVTHRSLYSLH